MLLLFFEIDFDSRKEGGSWNDCLMSIDGTDFRILQKGAMARGNKFASHKYGGKSALRYELGLDILEGNLVWIEGPYAAGKYPDVTIFQNCLKNNCQVLLRLLWHCWVPSTIKQVIMYNINICLEIEYY